ncbi:MAG: prenyltransferase/squalene oxidase repeat-containing protein [Planctomycetota bacterium]
MRFWTDHRIDEDNFQDAVQGLVRNAPWWGISALLHVLLLLVLSLFVTSEVAEEKGPILQAIHPEPPPDKIDDTEDVKPEKLDVEDVQQPDFNDADLSADTDELTDSPEGEVGDFSGPLEGPAFNPSIGLTGGSMGGRGPGGGGTGRGCGTRKKDPFYKEVDLGLRWLAEHQDKDGKWDCDDFAKHDPADDRCDGPGQPLYDVGVSSLALLAFLGAGHTDRGGPKARYAKNVRTGLRYLMRVQDDEGCFGARSSKHFMYNHAIATLAMCEAYWMTRNARYKRPAQKALDFIARARNPYGAWRYEPRGGENDLSVTGWMVMALKSGKYAGLVIDPDAFEGARRFVDKMTDPEFGNAGYDSQGGEAARPEGLQDRFPADKTASMTSVAVLTRIFLGEDPSKSAIIRKGVDICLERLPQWRDDGSIDMYYWYYGTLAIFQVGGRAWREWNKAMIPAIVKQQHAEGSGSRTGSWDPVGPWGADGGRVYSTALMVMCLEVFYRYDRVFGLSR